MKKFILKTFAFSSLMICIIIAYFILTVDGYDDPYYIRVSSPKQNNLILGTSRAAQGIVPDALSNTLGKSFFNFAFTLAHSPYGPVYFEAVKRKLATDKDNTFIVAVDPWSISSICPDPNDIANFRENNHCLNSPFINTSPNLAYWIKYFDRKFIKLILVKDTTTFLHNNGWLQINVEMDSTSVRKRTIEKVSLYNDKLSEYKYSEIRCEYLLKIVKYLSERGVVYLVRLPVGQGIYNIERKYMANFDEVISESIKLADGYLDMSQHGPLYQFVDGNHLYKKSSLSVSEEIALWIKNLEDIKELKSTVLLDRKK